jgi:hypothetical protein
MKFERLIHIYWIRYYLYNGQMESITRPFNSMITFFPGLGLQFKRLYLIFFEMTTRRNGKEIRLPFNLRHTQSLFHLRLNYFLSRVGNLNYSYHTLYYMNLTHRYVLKLYKGRAFYLARPIRGQKTRSNAKTAARLNQMKELKNLYAFKILRKIRKYSSFMFFFKRRMLKLRKTNFRKMFRRRLRTSSFWF